MRHIKRRELLGYAASAAASGPGTALAAAPGRVALLLGSSDPVMQTISRRLASAGMTVKTMPLPDSNDSAWRTEVAKVRDFQPAVNLVVNVAIPEPGGAAGTVVVTEFRRIIAATYTRTFFGLKHVGELLRSSGGGVFINVTSADGQHGAAGATARCVAANGITIMTKSAALEFAKWTPPVRVNALLVGDIVKGSRPQSGQVTADDVAAAVSYLADDASVYLTGLILPVANGGRRA